MNYSNIFIQILLGFILADIFSGFFHWFEDTYFDYCIDSPIIGNIAKDNELHHYFPRSILVISYFENIKSTLIFTTIILILIIIFCKSFFIKYIYLILSLYFFLTISNLLHRFSHSRDCENIFFIKLLQKTGILCSHKHHSIHHELSDVKYCVITEYSNHILDSIYFWRFLEYIIYMCTNIKPNRKLAYNDYYIIQNHMHENSKKECPDIMTRNDIQFLREKLKNYKNCNILS
jgi:ubiquitin-conjugating enzyme E2 variant